MKTIKGLVRASTAFLLLTFAILFSWLGYRDFNSHSKIRAHLDWVRQGATAESARPGEDVRRECTLDVPANIKSLHSRKACIAATTYVEAILRVKNGESDLLIDVPVWTDNRGPKFLVLNSVRVPLNAFRLSRSDWVELSEPPEYLPKDKKYEPDETEKIEYYRVAESLLVPSQQVFIAGVVGEEGELVGRDYATPLIFDGSSQEYIEQLEKGLKSRKKRGLVISILALCLYVAVLVYALLAAKNLRKVR